jgi:hypothetical protein
MQTLAACFFCLKVSHGLNVSSINMIIHKMQSNTMLYILSDALAIRFSTC